MSKNDPHWDSISALYDVADDYEIETLDELTERAGLIWTCEVCGWRNPADSTECENRTTHEGE